MEPQIGKPAAAPDPVPGDRINHHGDNGAVDTIGRKFRSLRHRPGYNGGRRRAEDTLKNYEGPFGDSGRKHRIIISHQEKIKSAENASPGTEHDTKPNKPEDRSSDTEIHQVFHNDIAGVLCSCKSGLHHGKSGLHKENKSGAKQHPYRIDSRHTLHLFSKTIPHPLFTRVRRLP